MSKKFNGHDSWAAWNIALWINNDEVLYQMAVDLCRHHTRDDAAALFLESLNECGIHETPDGARYTKTNIKKAFVGLDSVKAWLKGNKHNFQFEYKL